MEHDFAELLEASSLGTPAARLIRSMTGSEVVSEVRRRMTDPTQPAVADRIDSPTVAVRQVAPDPADAATSQEQRAPAPPIGRSRHFVLVGVDVARYSPVRRDDERRPAGREALYELLTRSFDASEIPWSSCLHEDRGDGALVVIPADPDDAPGTPSAFTDTVVDRLAEQLHVRLRQHNRLTDPAARMRLRLAVHVGEVQHDGHGLAGKAIAHLFRLLDEPHLGFAFRTYEPDLALMVSDSVIRGGPNPVEYPETAVRAERSKAQKLIGEIPAATGTAPGGTTHRLVLGMDIEKYAVRNEREQLIARVDLREALSLAARDVGLDESLWHKQVAGDGELMVLPEDTDVSTVVGDFTRRLEAVLGLFNRRVPADRRLRLRLALHHGTPTPGPYGPVGDASIVVSRLLGSRPLRRLAERHEPDIALILSATLFEDVVQTGLCSLDPADFRQVRVTATGVYYYGFIGRRSAGTPPGNDGPAIRGVRAAGTDLITLSADNQK